MIRSRAFCYSASGKPAEEDPVTLREVSCRRAVILILEGFGRGRGWQDCEKERTGRLVGGESLLAFMLASREAAKSLIAAWFERTSSGGLCPTDTRSVLVLVSWKRETTLGIGEKVCGRSSYVC